MDGMWLARRRGLGGVLAVAIITAAVLSACGGGGRGSGSSGSVFGIGFTGTLSGANASYALEMRQGVDLAVDELNRAGGIGGKNVVVTSADDQGSPNNGPVIARQFCGNDDINAVLGYSNSSVALAATPILAQCRLPVVASAVTSPDLSGKSPYFFRTVLTDAAQGAQMGAFVAHTLGIQRVATIYQNDDYGQGGNRAFVDAVKRAGGTVVSEDGYDPTTTEFSTTLSKVKSSNAQALYIDAFYPFAARVATQARALGLPQQLLGTDGSLSPDLPVLGRDAVEGMQIYGVFDPSVVKEDKAARFISAFKAKYHQDPSSWAALAYDAVYAVSNAAAHGASRDALARSLRDVRFAGVTGDVAFNSGGDRQGKILILQVQHGKFVLAPKQAAGSS